MIPDRRLSGNFRLSEFPRWEKATEAEVERLAETVQRVLQPTRNRWGPTVPTSWIWWSDGTRRTGAHGQGGTVDFVVPGADLRAVYSWGVEELLPGGYIGRWIYEPERFDPTTGKRTQGEHIHVAPRADMVDAFGKSDVGAFVETAEGIYEPEAGPWGGASGAYGDPIELPGIVATVPPNLFRWALLGALVGVIAYPNENRPGA